MAEATGTYTFADLWQRAAMFWKNSRNPGSDDVELLKDVVNDAYSRFLSAHDWTFASPTAQITTTANQDSDPLPDNFGELAADFAYASAENQSILMTERTSEWIEQMQGANGAPTGSPMFFAVEPSTLVAATGQRWRVMWYPTPNDAFTFNYRFEINHIKMVTDAEYPLGGTRHSYTIY